MLLAYGVRLVAAMLVAIPLTAASINVYLSAPGVQDTNVAGVEKENFDALPAGIRGSDFVTGVGTYRLGPNNALAIVTADGWGGANGTNYPAMGKQSATLGSVQLDLLGARSYFGFWWSAVDPVNVIQLYSNGSFVGQITRNDIVGFLPGNNSVTALGGSVHPTASFYGNPNNGLNPLEAYAYIHFIASGFTFDRLVFVNPSIQTGFESDNLAARATAPDPSSDWIPFREIPVTISNNQIPEPLTAGLMLCGLAFVIRRRGR